MRLGENCFSLKIREAHETSAYKLLFSVLRQSNRCYVESPLFPSEGLQ